jgi:hypothetical protein
MPTENKSNKIITIVLALIIIVAAITILYVGLPQNEENNTSSGTSGQQGGGNQTGSVVLTVIYGDKQTNYTLQQLENLTSYPGMGGRRKNSGVIEGQGNYTGVTVIKLVELTAGGIENYSIIATSNYKGEITNTTYNYSYVLGNVDIYDPNDPASSTPIGNGGLTMVLAYKYEGDYLNESNDGKLRIAFLDENGSITYSQLWYKSVISLEIVEQ